ncbi:MAG: carbon-nitrogen hydrolase family protein [Pseudomonadota bacterium]
MDSRLHIACLQTRPMPDFASAWDEAFPLARQAVSDGAKMLFLPEYCGGLKSDGPRLVPPSAPVDKHPFLAKARTFAAENGVWIMVGSVAIDAPDGKILNRGFMIDDQGQITGQYDKINMFDIQLSGTEIFRESDTVLAGKSAVIHETPWANIGHAICYDLRFPILYRELAQAGAQILTCPAAFTKKTGEAHWHVLNRARAIENTSFLVSPCAIGAVPGGGECFGHSLIIDPWGEILADGGDKPGVISAKIDLARVQEVRSKIPSLTHDRDFTLTELNDLTERKIA